MKLLTVMILAPVYMVANSNGIPPWIDWGVLGAVVMALVVTKQLVPGWLYSQVKDENKSLREENKQLVNKLLSLSESAIPALRESTMAVTSATDEIRRRRR